MLLLGWSHAASTHPLHLHTFLFSFLPLLSASPGALPSYQDAVLSDNYPFPVWRRSGRWPSVIWTIETLRPCYCRFIGNWPNPHHPLMLCCCLWLQLWAPSCVVCQLISDFKFLTVAPSLANLFELSLKDFWMLSYFAMVFHLKISWILLQLGSQFSTWEREVPGYPASRSGCELDGASPLHSHLLTPPGSIHLHIITMFTSQWQNYCILFNSACLTCKVWRCNTQMWLAQGTGSQPPGITSR